jgi:hypothetical protein
MVALGVEQAMVMTRMGVLRGQQREYFIACSRYDQGLGEKYAK